MNKKIWLSSPHMGGAEMKYIQEAFEQNWIAPLGENVTEFENSLQRYLGVGHATALSSGTAALHLALINLGVTREDEVLVQSLTFSASVNPIVYQGATPILIDSEPETWNMDPEILEKAIKDRLNKGKKPKAIVMVHLYGMPAKVDEIMNISKKYEIPVVEDAAEALGSKYKEKQAGTFGEMGVLSFNGNKIITTSGGGALVSDHKEYTDKALFLATQARDQAPHYQHSHIGYNYRMSNILAGIGRGQMEILDQRVQQRRANFNFYYNQLNGFEEFTFLTEPDGFFSNYWLTTCTIRDGKGKLTREHVRTELQKKNIETRPLWKPMHLQPVFKDYPAYVNGVSENLFEYGLCLPSGSNLTDEDKNWISSEIHGVVKNIKGK